MFGSELEGRRDEEGSSGEERMRMEYCFLTVVISFHTCMRTLLTCSQVWIIHCVLMVLKFILIGTGFYNSVIRNMAHESFLAWSAWA